MSPDPDTARQGNQIGQSPQRASTCTLNPHIPIVHGLDELMKQDLNLAIMQGQRDKQKETAPINKQPASTKGSNLQIK